MIVKQDTANFSNFSVSSPLDDMTLLNKYKTVYSNYSDDGIIDLDKRLKHKFDFQIYRLEDVLPALGGVLPPTRQTPYWMALVKKGVGEKSIGLFSFPIKDYTLFIVPKRVMHSSRYFSQDCTGFVMSFNIDFFMNKAFPKQHIVNRKVLKSSVKPFLYLHGGQRSLVEDIFESIVTEHLADGSEKGEMIAIKVLELLILCDRLFSEANQTGNDILYHPIIEKFTELVENSYDQQRSVRYYADILNVHPNHLNYLLKKHSGLNAKVSINNRIILESKCLLSSSELIIKEIAHRVGFDDPNNFSTFFQKNTGHSPAIYRSSCHQFNTHVGQST